MVRLLSVCLLLLPVLASAALSARFDPDTLRINETTRLIVETDEEMQGDVDLAQVEKYFGVLNQATTQHVTILGSRQTIVQRLIVELEPKEVGSFSIGPIVQGAQRSEVLRVTVLPRAKGASGNGDLFIEAEVDHDRVYVQQQVVLTVKLFLGVRLLDGSLSDPDPPATRVDRMGEDKRYQVDRNGRPYTVYERRYALFPQSSGTLQIPPLQFQGIAEDKTRGGQVFGSLFDQGRRIRATSSAMKIDVAPPAATFSGKTWLPASQLQIDEVGTVTEQVEAGQPLTRKIQVQAQGLTAEQLPDIDFGSVADLRFYPDKPTRDTAVDGDLMVGVQQNSVAVIGAVPGVATLPEIRIDWWNTRTDQQQSAILPPREIRIVATDNVATVPPTSQSGPNSPTSAGPGVPADLPADDAASAPAAENSSGARESRIWKVAALGALGLWLLTAAGFILFHRTSRRRRSVPTEQTVDGSAIGDWRNRLRKACRDNDAAAARTALTGWLKASYGRHADFDFIYGISGGLRLANLAVALDRQLYGTQGNGLPWKGQALWNAFASLPSANNRQQGQSTLEELYPRADVR